MQTPKAASLKSQKKQKPGEKFQRLVRTLTKKELEEIKQKNGQSVQKKLSKSPKRSSLSSPLKLPSSPRNRDEE